MEVGLWGSVCEETQYAHWTTKVEIAGLGCKPFKLFGVLSRLASEWYSETIKVVLFWCEV